MLALQKVHHDSNPKVLRDFKEGSLGANSMSCPLRETKEQC